VSRARSAAATLPRLPRAAPAADDQADPMPDFFLDRLWPGALVWSALYVSDYTFTLLCARLYQAGANQKMGFDGSYEITPYYQRDIDALRRVSPRFVLALGIGIAMLFLARLLDPGYGLYEFVLGVMIGPQLVIHIRHVRNYCLFHAMVHGDGVRGRLDYSRTIMLKLSSLEISAFAVLLLVLFVFTSSWFVLGGAAACLSLAGSHRTLARRAAAQRSATPKAPPVAAATRLHTAE
jgi:hypothetical protein